jgi:hypothetical protein
MLFQFISVAFLATFAACMPTPQLSNSDIPINCGTITLLGKENTVTNIVAKLNGECNVVSDGIGVLTLNGNSRCGTMFMFEYVIHYRSWILGFLIECCRSDKCESPSQFSLFLPDVEGRTLDPNQDVSIPLKSYLVIVDG